MAKKSSARKKTAKGASRVTGKKASAQTGQGRVIAAVICFAFALFLVIAFYMHTAGAVGNAITDFFFGVFGKPGYAVPVAFIAIGLLIFIKKRPPGTARNAALASAIYFSSILIFAGFDVDLPSSPLKGASFSEVFTAGSSLEGGGLIGMYVDAGLVKIIGVAGMFLFAFALFVIMVILLCYPYFAHRLVDYAGSRAEIREERQAAKEARLQAEDFKKDDLIDKLAEGGGEDEYEAVADSPSRFFGRRDRDSALARKREKILSAVSDDSTLTGEEEHLSNTGLLPDDDELGFGVEGARVAPPGTGLGDDYNNGFVSSLRKDDEDDSPQITPEIPEDDEPDNAPEIADELETTFTLDDVEYDPDKNAAPMDEAMTAISRPKPAPQKPKKPKVPTPYKLPPVDLLSKGKKAAGMQNAADLRHRAQRLEQALKDFRVEASVANVIVGPSVTRYEVEPDVGVKIQSIKSLESDLALKLEVDSVRVVPMPGKAVIGIEASNTSTTIVTLRDIIDSPEFRMADSKISFVLGKDISGARIIEDLAEMPHLLIAGTTGSGKSVCINSILLSILYRARPEEVRFIMIDPKIVELRNYNDIPHLLLPVVSEPERAATALGYAVTIMEDRYRKFADMHVSSLKDYNEKIAQGGKSVGEEDEAFSQIVIIIDELSDLMLVAPAKVQEYINRLAAKARAAGIHLIVATQQPLASILTSVIKANIPSRIAFSVASNSSSRVILDEPGAERLLGKGDMLFKSVSMREPARIQGSFVNNSEVKRVTDFIRKQSDPNYSPDIMEVVSENTTGQFTEDEDEFFRDAVEMVAAAKQASVSMIQRRFRIGYNRAARLVDMMEERGIVASSDGTNKPRKIIMTNEQLRAFLGEGAADTGGDEDNNAVNITSNLQRENNDDGADVRGNNGGSVENVDDYANPPFDMSDDAERPWDDDE
jgi:S-DNA-T family DNA segregation ATPase FtsK/SpoIIIE